MDHYDPNNNEEPPFFISNYILSEREFIGESESFKDIGKIFLISQFYGQFS